MIPKPAYRSFAPFELAFFWKPRNWKEISARFGDARSGSADIRDAIIEVDEDGGLGLLRWHAAIKSWALTDVGKKRVSDLAAPKMAAAERDWVLPDKKRAPKLEKREAVDDGFLFEWLAEDDDAPPAAAESPEEELRRLAAEQSADD